MNTVNPSDSIRNGYLEVYHDRLERANNTQDPALKQHFQTELAAIQQTLDALGGQGGQSPVPGGGPQAPGQVPPSGASAGPSDGQGDGLGGGDAGGVDPGPQGPGDGEYDAIVEKYAQQYGIDSAVMKSLMAKESQGDTNAVSSAGAVGLLQLKPATASEMAGRQISAEALKQDPELNIQLGTAYLARMIDEKGSLEDALGAYNQGPNADWRSSAEGRDYVKSIMESLQTGQLPSWG
ncbi:lytic transglycosylase domain-containing protein [Exilibacterium tricleocarpae]|uniref:Lytic transglycosylase domain-containing protein n=1 Tax=Exilibacterium tricleocarpae TaxID=2591008 RepID=A0A545SLF2_9GAMM|nr:transglycosylase SLT domain-containing protein [Exilibacterium tricleocarpae]TQV65656.1 lytic transglycosylase domain-containing protein [Exilibacterium tricleocarpae]